MLTIRNAQMEVLAREIRRRFEQQVLLHLRKSLPDSVARFTDGELLHLIEAAVSKAHGYNITLQPDVVRFIEYVFLYDPEFDALPAWDWAVRILNSAQLSGTQKMDRMDATDQFLR